MGPWYSNMNIKQTFINRNLVMPKRFETWKKNLFTASKGPSSVTPLPVYSELDGKDGEEGFLSPET